MNARQVQWKDWAHFLAIGARIMRRILIDYARSRPKAARTELTETLAISPGLDLDLVLLDHALKALAEFDERKAKVVEMKFFGASPGRKLPPFLRHRRRRLPGTGAWRRRGLVHQLRRTSGTKPEERDRSVTLSDRIS